MSKLRRDPSMARVTARSIAILDEGIDFPLRSLTRPEICLNVEQRLFLTEMLAAYLGLSRVSVPRVRRSSVKLKQRPQEPQAGGRESLSSAAAAPLYDHPLLPSPRAIGCSR